MKIVYIDEKDKERWNQFVENSTNCSFLQSFEWGKFQESLGRKIWRIVVKEREEWQAGMLLVQHNLPLVGSYLYCPRGPIFLTSREFLVDLLNELKKIARAEKSFFVRIDPEIEEKSWEELSREHGFIKSGYEIQPKETLILNIEKSEEDLLATMKSKARYNIRLAIRKKVKVRKSGAPKDLNRFWQIIRKTASRGKFKPYPEQYYKKFLNILGKENFCRLFVAEYKNKTIAANLVIFFGDCATYVHGASDYRYRNLMAPHLLQWEQIKEAKKRRCSQYDFWGIGGWREQEDKWASYDKNHPWWGVTRFKIGFGGKPKNYIGAHDLVLNNGLYQIYNVLRGVGRIL